MESPPPVTIRKPRTSLPSSCRNLRDEAQVVDVGDHAVGLGAGERHLELARQQLRQRVPHEVAHEGAGVGRGVVDLVVADAAPRVAGDVAHGVAAGLAGRQPGVAQHANGHGRQRQRHVVILHVLARGDVALLERGEPLGHFGEGVELIGRDAAERQLDADHLDVGLALPVDPLLQPKAGEQVRIALAAQEGRRLGVEVLELFVTDRNDAPRRIGRMRDCHCTSLQARLGPC